MNHVLSTLLILLAHYLWAQSAFNGMISDNDGNVIEGVAVFNRATFAHTHTDTNGRFSLKVSIGDTLSFSHVGYEKVSFVLKELTPQRFTMQETAYELSQITILPELNAMQKIQQIDLQVNPVNSSQDLLRKVPGLFIGQHAGGGKAEQIFLRGFDADHGTDVAISVDGIPVNMVSHAHGQGYADLHFLIPETIEAIDFSKGPYQTQYGNFATAGQVNFRTKSKVKSSSVKLEGGMFNTRRLVGIINLLSEDNPDNAYIATEYLYSDGPFESPQDFDRINIFGKYTKQVDNTKITLQGSTFSSAWNASGQIPQRAVDDGLIGRFGAIDNTEGGKTGRTNLSLNIRTILSEKSFTETLIFYSNYDFKLFSNFTFFLNDPVNGDQILQRESRSIYGLKSYYAQQVDIGSSELNLEAGVNLRFDRINGDELAHTKNRVTVLDTLSLGNVRETNGALYVDAKWKLNRWLINAGLRYDEFMFNYEDFLSNSYQNQGVNKSTLSPKFNVIFNPTRNFQVYAKSGKGFHSNDTRVIMANTTSHILPAAWGVDWGTIYRPFPRLYLNVAYWYLFMQQEFVYVGDEGVVEPSGRTIRHGVDLSMNYQLADGLFLDMNLNLANPRSIDEQDGNNYIPLAPTVTSTGGISYRKAGFNGSMRYRYMGDRAANEDYSVVAKGYTVTDMNVSYGWEKLTLGLVVQNLFNVDWNETQFDTTSRLKDEPAPVSEIHFTPGAPFFAKLSTSFKF